MNDVTADPRYVTPPGVPGARAELAVPMIYGDEVLGVINVEGDQPFDELDRMSLGIVAEHLAVAIHNARLNEQSQRLAVLEERQRLARELHDNVTQILSSISLMAPFERILKQVSHFGRELTPLAPAPTTAKVTSRRTSCGHLRRYAIERLLTIRRRRSFVRASFRKGNANCCAPSTPT